MSILSQARNAFASINSQMGTSVTLYSVVETYNTQGDLVKTKTSSTITACMEPVAEMTSEGDFGRIVTGEFNLYLPHTTTVVIGDEVLADSKTYQVQDILDAQVGGSAYLQCVIKLVQ